MTLRHDTPTPASVVSKDMPFPLPASATNVYLLTFAGGLQDFDLLLRFEVPAADLDGAVNGLLSRNNTDYRRSLPYPRQELSSAPELTPRKEFLPIAWWDVASIRHGYYRGEPDNHALEIWVDSDHHRVFVHHID